MSEPIAWIIRLPNGWYKTKENSLNKRRGHTGSMHARQYPTREAAQADCGDGDEPVALLSKWGKTA